MAAFVARKLARAKNGSFQKAWLGKRGESVEIVESAEGRVSMAQLIEHRIVMREVVSSTPAGPTLRVLKITEQKMLPL